MNAFHPGSPNCRQEIDRPLANLQRLNAELVKATGFTTGFTG
jgi:hypothetical protein